MSKFLEEIVLPEQESPGTPANGNLALFAKTDGLHYVRSDGVQVGPMGPARPDALKYRGIYDEDVNDATYFYPGDTVSYLDGLYVAQTEGYGDVTEPIAQFELIAGPPLTGPPASADDFVTLDTEQTITGIKNFANELSIGGTSGTRGAARFGPRLSLASNAGLNITGIGGTSWLLDNTYFDGTSWRQGSDPDTASLMTMSAAGDGFTMQIAKTTPAAGEVITFDKVFRVKPDKSITGYGNFATSGNIAGWAITGNSGTFTATGSTVVPLTVRAFSSGTANILEAQDGAGVTRASINHYGTFVGTAASFAARSTGDVSIVVNGMAGQTTPQAMLTLGANATGDFLMLRNNAGAVLSSINSAGHFIENGNRLYSDANPPMTNWNDRQLKRFREALNRTDVEPADILFIGESQVEGVGATTDDLRFQGLIRRALQLRYNPSGVTGGRGYIPARHTGSTPAAQWTYGGGYATASGAEVFGLGRRAIRLDAVGEYAQTVQTTDRVWVHYTYGVNAGAFVISIDGVDVATVDAYAPTTAEFDGAGSRYWDSGPLTPGQHTIRVTQAAATATANPAGAVLSAVDGIMVFNGDGAATPGEGLGVRTWDSGRGGYRAADFDGTTTTTEYWSRPLVHVAPDLVIIEFGGNEYLQQNTPASFETALNKLIDLVRARTTTDPSILLVAIHDLTSGNPATITYPWALYEDVIKRVAVAKNCAFLDVGEKIPAAGGSTGTDLYAEAIHTNNNGHRAYAEEYTYALVGTRLATMSASGGTPANMVTTDTTQTITGVKTFGVTAGPALKFGTRGQLNSVGDSGYLARGSYLFDGVNYTGAGFTNVGTNGGVIFGSVSSGTQQAFTIYTATPGVDGAAASVAERVNISPTAADFKDLEIKSTLRVRTSSLAALDAGKAYLNPDADSGGMVLMTNGVANKGLVIRGFTGQTANLFEVQNSGNTSQFYITNLGTAISVAGMVVSGMAGTSGSGWRAAFRAFPTEASSPAVILRGATGQTANIFEVQSDTGALLSRFSADGSLYAPAVYDGGNRVYSASNPPPGGTGAPANMVTTDTAQTISGLKTFTPASPGAMVMRWGTRQGLSVGSNFMFFMENATTSDNGTTYQAIENSVATISGNINGGFGVWTAPAVASGTTQTFTQKLSINATTTNLYSNTVSGTGNWTTTAQVSAGSFRSTITNAGNSRWVGSTPTGAPTAGTWAVNDWIIARDTGRIWQCTVAGTPGTWAEMTLPSGSGGAPANMVTTDTAQTISAAKTFTVAPVVPDASFAIAKVNGLQGALDAKYSATNPPPAPDLSTYATTAYVDNRFTTLTGAAPAALDTLTELAAALGNDANFASTVTTSLAGKVSLTGDETIAGVKTFSSAPIVPDASFGIIKISATGTRDATTFLRGDGTWASVPLPLGMVDIDSAQTILGQKTFSTITSFDDGLGPPTVITPGGGISTGYLDAASITVNGMNVYTRDNPPPVVLREVHDFAITGNLSVQKGKSRIYFDGDYYIESIRVTVNTPSTGAPIIIDVNYNGTTFFTTQSQRPTLAAGANTIQVSPAGLIVGTGEYVTVDVDQVGTTTPGADLVVTIKFRKV